MLTLKKFKVMWYNVNTMIIRDVAQFGSAFGWGPKGRKFKSCRPDHEDIKRDKFLAFFIKKSSTGT